MDSFAEKFVEERRSLQKIGMGMMLGIEPNYLLEIETKNSEIFKWRFWAEKDEEAQLFADDRLFATAEDLAMESNNDKIKVVKLFKKIP